MRGRDPLYGSMVELGAKRQGSSQGGNHKGVVGGSGCCERGHLPARYRGGLRLQDLRYEIEAYEEVGLDV